ncbi:DUF427-domain-containing protein [Irpex rosettiformis]|uniref:DUF427-domain-containing protein n=1 Tax=Irpex rosettiformis TaxID=378272 RepID=A0ACB8TWU2_9APHY|nr:DUF427-domain-containing protein [Irpex rosettiformis]
MVRVVLNGQVIADSAAPVSLEGNYYFPPDSVNRELLETSATPYSCPWKGKAAYWNANIGGIIVKDAAWSYPQPKDAAKNIAGHYAFDKRKVSFEN